MAKMWEKHAHISKVIDKDFTVDKFKRLVKVAQSHTNYQCSMLLEDIVGITNLEVTAPIFDKKSHNLLGILSLCQVLLRYLQLSDGHQLITEVHQPNKIMGPVQAFIPNTPKAERTILMMNMNVPSYIENALKDQGMPESFLIDLVKNSCCPTQVPEIMNCHQKAARKTVLSWKRHCGSRMHLPIWAQWLMGNQSSKPRPPRPCSTSKNTSMLKWPITVMNKQPLPQDTHPHRRAKARLST